MKASLQMLAKSPNGLLSVLLTGLAGGGDTIQDHSLTYALWSDSRDTSHCRPQADSKLKLAVCQSVDAGFDGADPIWPGGRGGVAKGGWREHRKAVYLPRDSGSRNGKIYQVIAKKCKAIVASI